ncbi:MAG: hypothetical protein HQ558_05955 [Candidatus Omnitrophica bacterium]|nr:hypothetical protein [Candidatus Omnitrophota bacterium]
MSFLIFAGCLAFLTGIMLILFPGALRGVSVLTNKVLQDIDKSAFELRLGLGISLILTAACLWFIAYYMKVIPLLRTLS